MDSLADVLLVDTKRYLKEAIRQIQEIDRGQPLRTPGVTRETLLENIAIYSEILQRCGWGKACQPDLKVKKRSVDVS
jgi:hypothetical protein